MRVSKELMIGGFLGLLALILMFGVLHKDNERLLKEKSAAEGKENQARQIAVIEKAVHQEPIYTEPELQMSELMLQPRSKIEAKLGHPISPAVECADTRGKQYEYADGSYLCADKGLVILFSYVLREPVARSVSEISHLTAPGRAFLIRVVSRNLIRSWSWSRE